MYWESFGETEMIMGNKTCFVIQYCLIYLKFKVTPLSVIGMTVVVALLFSFVELNERHTDRNTSTCTDVQCLLDKLRR